MDFSYLSGTNIWSSGRKGNLGKNCRICREWQEHCYWSHMADERKHFFKPMVGDFNESMSIPGKFANNFNGYISEVVNLKSPSGKTWSIGVTICTDDLVLRSGWKEFVSAHSIEEGNYLLFKYSGVSSFDVLIFDSSGCEKTLPHFADNHGYKRISTGVKVTRHGSHRSMRDEEECTRQAVPRDGDDVALPLHRNTGKSISKARKRNRFHDTEQAYCEVEDDEDVVELSEDEAPTKTGYYFCKNGPVSEYHLAEEEKEAISRIRVPVQSRNPVVVQVMHPSHVRGKTSNVLGLCSEFAAKYLGTIRREIILQRASGKGKWLVRYNGNKFCRGICGRGWCVFVDDNGLLHHDVCLFELMKGTRRPTMTVHVLRRVRGRFVLLR